MIKLFKQEIKLRKTLNYHNLIHGNRITTNKKLKLKC